MDIQALQRQIADSSQGRALPPVDNWDPDFCGNMNLVIRRNGQWWHEGTPFTRSALIQLFSSVLKKENDQYFLVTPVEKIGIQVEDVPFIIIDDDVVSGYLEVTTSCGDRVQITDKNPVELRMFEGNLVPYCLIRRNLWARVHQNVLYRWVDNAVLQHEKTEQSAWLNSGKYHFCIGTFAI